jgi:hypothetical protein
VLSEPEFPVFPMKNNILQTEMNGKQKKKIEASTLTDIKPSKYTSKVHRPMHGLLQDTD